MNEETRDPLPGFGLCYVTNESEDGGGKDGNTTSYGEPKAGRPEPADIDAIQVTN